MSLIIYYKKTNSLQKKNEIAQYLKGLSLCKKVLGYFKFLDTFI